MVRYYSVLMIIVVFSCKGTGKTTSEVTASDRSLIQKHWVHYHEGDTPGTQVFKPFDFDFPLSRGREAYHFQSNGKLTFYRIAPNDLIEPSNGKWTLLNDTTIRIEYIGNEYPATELILIDVSPDRLIIRK
jgi:hypothetical protein